MSRTVDLTSCPVPRESPARAAARSRQRRKRSTSHGRQMYCPSSAYQKPKHARSSPGRFCAFMSAIARATTSAITHPHCMDARGSPCSAPLRALYFSPEGRKTIPQLSWHHRDHGWSSGTRAPTAVSMASWRSVGNAFWKSTSTHAHTPYAGSDLIAASMVSRVWTRASAPQGIDTPNCVASTITFLTLVP